MSTYRVNYGSGESRLNPGTAVDFMDVMVEDADGDEYLLYAEIDPAGLSDEHGNPALVDGDFNPACNDPERLSAPYLIKAIREMCDEIGLDPDTLDFDGYDAPDWPVYMVRGVEADCRIS